MCLDYVFKAAHVFVVVIYLKEIGIGEGGSCSVDSELVRIPFLVEDFDVALLDNHQFCFLGYEEINI